MRERYPGLVEIDEFRALREYSVACLPLRVESRCTGVLVFSFGDARAFDESDRAFLLVLARHAAQALERARLFEAERRARAEAEAANERSAFLSEASVLLASSLDFEATLASVGRLAVPRIADWFAIDLADEFWRGEPSAIVMHADPAKVERARESQRRLPTNRSARNWIPEVLRTGRAEIYPSLTDRVLEEMAESPQHLGAARELEVRSAMVVPIRARDRILGAMTFVSGSLGRFGDADLRMAQHLANLAFVSHDLKNPLSTVLICAALMERSPDPRHTRHVAAIRRSAERMERLIRDLLDISAMDEGRLSLERRPCSAPPLLAEAVALAQSLADEKGVSVEVEARPDPPTVLADRDRVLQVLSNLVGNAVAFTPPEGRVVLACAGASHGILFEVRDDGPGINEEDQPHVFERFWKSRDSRRGSGLGLAIARGIVEAHGGRIWFETRPGSGTTFYFTLPSSEQTELAATRG